MGTDKKQHTCCEFEDSENCVVDVGVLQWNGGVGIDNTRCGRFEVNIGVLLESVKTFGFGATGGGRCFFILRSVVDVDGLPTFLRVILGHQIYRMQ